MIKKRGMTLIELIVAITLFIVIVTLAIGGFVSITRIKTLMIDMKNTQQKTRLIYETIYRFAKEANVVEVTGGGYGLVLDFYKEGSLDEQKIFIASGTPVNSLVYYVCSDGIDHFHNTTDYADPGVCNSEDLLLGTASSSYTLGKVVDGEDMFIFDRTIPATLRLNMTVVNNQSTMDAPIKLDNTIILENVK